MDKDKQTKLYNLASILYGNIKDSIEAEDGLNYFEVVGILEQLKQHFSTNTAINITDIRIKRDITRNFKCKY